MNQYPPKRDLLNSLMEFSVITMASVMVKVMVMVVIINTIIVPFIIILGPILHLKDVQIKEDFGLFINNYFTNFYSKQFIINMAMVIMNNVEICSFVEKDYDKEENLLIIKDHLNITTITTNTFTTNVIVIIKHIKYFKDSIDFIIYNEVIISKLSITIIFNFLLEKLTFNSN